MHEKNHPGITAKFGFWFNIHGIDSLNANTE